MSCHVFKIIVLSCMTMLVVSTVDRQTTREKIFNVGVGIMSLNSENGLLYGSKFALQAFAVGDFSIPAACRKTSNVKLDLLSNSIAENCSTSVISIVKHRLIVFVSYTHVTGCIMPVISFRPL